MKPSLRHAIVLAYWWTPPFLVASIQFGLSSWSSPPSPPFVFPGWDKVAHAVIYGMMAATTLRAIRGYHHWPVKKAFIATMILCVIYGMTDEIHQCFVPGRSPEWRDWIADAVGSLAGILAWLLWERIALDPPDYFKRRRNPETDQSRLA